jgi:hypothetical protein
MLDVKAPIPKPLLVFVDRDMVGFGLIDQTTPLPVIGDPPSDVIFPPQFAALGLMSDTELVLMRGRVDNQTGLPVLSVDNICPGKPGARLTHVVPFQYCMLPGVFPVFLFQ